MGTEHALHFGMFPVSLAKNNCSRDNGSATRSYTQVLKLSRGDHPQPAFNTIEQFNATSLSLRAAMDQSEGSSSRQKSCIYGVKAAQNASSSLYSSTSTSRRGSQAVTDFDQLGLQSILVRNPANTPVLETSQAENEERMKKLQYLAELRQGRILESRVFRQTYVIRSYEVYDSGTTSIETILRLFQEVALNHVSLLGIAGDGLGATLEMNRYRLIWVVTRLHVEVERYPTWPEAVEIDSWTDSAGKNGMRRDWLIREYGTGEIIARATSTWAVMNQDTRKLSKMPDDVRTEIEYTFIPEHALEDLTLQRVPKLDNTAKMIQSNLTPFRTDLDGNHHINNVTYVRWVKESTPLETMKTHELSSITLEYRRECNKDDIVESLTDLKHGVHGIDDTSRITNSAGPPQKDLESEDTSNVANRLVNGSSKRSNGAASIQSDVSYIHLLRLQLKGEEILRGRTVWKRKEYWPDSTKSQQFPR